jgi:hypothetical protein
MAAVPERLRAQTLTATSAALPRAGVSAWPFLAVIVGASFVIRAVLGWFRETPLYLGDEYLYASLGRSLAESGRPLVRGHAADFPALLQPILTAPAWLFGDVEIGYHLAQTIGALVMALGAIPAYWLARRLGLGTKISLGLAALAVALPDLVFGSWIVAEPIAYPLVLAAVAAAVVAVAAPSRRTQVLFVVLAGLAAFARIQFVLLPGCFLGAVVLVGLRERRLRPALREQLLPLALLAVPVAAAIVLGPSRVLAFYSGVIDVDLDPVALVVRSGRNLLVLLYASGFVLVPGALLGLGLAIMRPRTRAELAFGALTLLLALVLLVEAGLFGASDLPQERYLFYVLPLAAICFGLYASRGWPYRLQHSLLAAGAVTVAAVVPLSGYAAADEKMHSPLLYGTYRVEQWLGSPGDGSLAIALVATLAVAALVASTFRPRIATAVGLGLAVSLCLGYSTAATVFDLESTSSARHAFFGRDPSWIDHARLGHVTLLRNVGGQRGASFQQLFWNRSLTDIALMPGATEIDPFPVATVSVASDGTLLVGARPLTGPLLVDENAVTMRLRGARKVASAPGFWLYRPVGRPRVSLLFVGRYHDGWLSNQGIVRIWPRPGRDRLRGTLMLELRGPAQAAATTVRFKVPGRGDVTVAVPHEGVMVRLPVSARGPWTLEFESPITGYVGLRPVSVEASVPRLVPGPCRCPLPATPRPAGESA